MAKTLEKLGYGELGWIAGFLEGEGSFGTANGREKRPHITAGSVDKDRLEYLQQLIGGHLYGPYPGKKSTHKPTYTWIIYRVEESIPLMQLIYPLMGERRQQTIVKVLNEYSAYKTRIKPKKIFTEEHRKNITKGKTGIKVSQEGRDNISKAHKGLKWSTTRRASYEAKKKKP